ncbi:MAG TPA: NUDIX domain-containing protein [Candidatus Saccharimonadales bacterium]|nr:NUDIX domain-containing protein [Candidatus Saccharimonadales bacterium]
MPKHSAGVLLFRRVGGNVEVLLAHPGGPFWAKKDSGVWSIPKGEFSEDEDPKHAAQREFMEEIGHQVPAKELIDIGEIKMSSGKIVTAWAGEGDLDPNMLVSNTFSMEWPPRSGTQQEFPEVDRARWFTLVTAKNKILKAQVPFIENLATHLSVDINKPEKDDPSSQLSLL